MQTKKTKRWRQSTLLLEKEIRTILI